MSTTVLNDGWHLVGTAAALQMSVYKGASPQVSDGFVAGWCVRMWQSGTGSGEWSPGDRAPQAQGGWCSAVQFGWSSKLLECCCKANTTAESPAIVLHDG
jgi:hypothetical protein